MIKEELELLDAVDDAIKQLDDIRRELRSTLEAYEYERDSALCDADQDGL
jgi:chromosome segregation ATPase